MIFSESIRRIRKFLRDPKGKIWTEDLIRDHFNDSQNELQTKTGVLESARAIKVPQFIEVGYTHPWEHRFLPDGIDGARQVFRYAHNSGYSYNHYFEQEIEFGNDGSATEEGASITFPWESFYITPSEEVIVSLPSDFHSAKFAAWDRKPLQHETLRNVQCYDSSYISRTGEPFCYYFKDEINKDIVLYPRPSTVVFDDPEKLDYQYVYTFDWETDHPLSGTGEKWTKSGDDIEYVHSWELNNNGLSDDFSHGMFLFELQNGVALYVSGDAVDDVALLIRIDGHLSINEGASLDVIDIDDNLFVIYKVVPNEVQQGSDEISFPGFLVKYVEYGVLERAYSANTDGKIVSLADYWRFRYEIGQTMIKTYMNNRRADKVYRLRTETTPPLRSRRHARLPDTYPAV